MNDEVFMHFQFLVHRSLFIVSLMAPPREAKGSVRYLFLEGGSSVREVRDRASMSPPQAAPPAGELGGFSYEGGV